MCHINLDFEWLRIRLCYRNLSQIYLRLFCFILVSFGWFVHIGGMGWSTILISSYNQLAVFPVQNFVSLDPEVSYHSDDRDISEGNTVDMLMYCVQCNILSRSGRDFITKPINISVMKFMNAHTSSKQE